VTSDRSMPNVGLGSLGKSGARNPTAKRPRVDSGKEKKTSFFDPEPSKLSNLSGIGTTTSRISKKVEAGKSGLDNNFTKSTGYATH
jgi:hypothetical protein